MLPFGIGFILYSVIAYCSYVKFSNQYYPFIIAIVFGSLSNCTWMYIAQNGTSSKDILTKGLMWDFMITGIYLAIPLILLDIPGLSWYNKLGVIIILIGLVLLKL